MINKQAEILADFDYCSPELEEAYTEFSKAMNAEMNSFEKEMANFCVQLPKNRYSTL